MALLEMNQLLF